jgi:dephospho-CoA kinase
MPVLGITGGPACGKSSFRELLSAHFPEALTFSADAEVKRLTELDPEVRSEISALLGEAAYSSDGTYNRESVRGLVFERPDVRAQLNAILHPRVRRSWSSLAERCRSNENWLLAEIPLLYETAGETLCDRVITVACSAETQIQRLTVLRGLSSTLSQQILCAQGDLQQKSNRADHLIWNDCPFNCLIRQSSLCASWLKVHFS